MDSDRFRTRDGVRTTLRKRLAAIPDIHGVGEDALVVKKRKRTLGKQLGIASGLRQVGVFAALGPFNAGTTCCF